jgi:hypothetical protein
MKADLKILTFTVADIASADILWRTVQNFLLHTFYVVEVDGESIWHVIK